MTASKRLSPRRAGRRGTITEVHNVRAVTLDVFVCNVSSDNSTKAERLLDALVVRFDAERVNRQQLVRGLAP